MRWVAATVAALCVASTMAFARAYYAGKKEMIEDADAIAVVTIKRVVEANERGSDWTYHQKAIGVVGQVIKGHLDEEIVIYGMEDFICAQCVFGPGRFLLFLRKDGHLWRGSNWQLGIRRIADGEVEWFKDDDTSRLAPRSLAHVLAEIRDVLTDGAEQGASPDAHNDARP